MVSPTRIGARLVNDGTLYVYEPSTIDEGLDEYTQTNISFTRTNVFAKEFDEVTIATHAPSGGSIQLNGSSQKLNITGSLGDFEFDSNDFTIEGWFYLNDNTKYTRLWCFPDGDNLEVQSGSLYYWNGSSTILNSGASTVPQGAWFNVALVKHQGHVTVYLGGSSVITDSNPYNSRGSRALTIGGEVSGLGVNDDPASAGWLDGYVTNFRIVKGAALYLSNFSTPYAPFNSIDNTVLLLNAADIGHLLTDSSASAHTVTGIGNPTYSSTSPLSSVYNGAMKQLKNGTIQVGNEFDETTVLS